MGLELGDDLRAEFEAAPALAFGVVLDEEAAPFRMEPGDELDDGAADGEDAGGEVQVLDAEFGQFAPAEALSMSVSTRSWAVASGSAS